MDTKMHDPDRTTPRPDVPPSPPHDPSGPRPEDDSPLAGLDAGGLLGAAEASDPALGAIQPLFPSYRIVERIGRGATSSVYRARHRKLDRSVAIKILDPELGATPGFLERFQREARATARLQHPFIVTVLDFGDVEGVLYLVLEDCGGRTLRDLLARGTDGRRDVLLALARVAEALDYAHGERAVHRDLKPENVLIDAHGHPRVADFGLARIADPGTPRLTRTGDVMGTPHYMAPEQVHGHDVDHRADVYALGVMTYEALTGTLPVGRFDPPDATRRRDPALLELVMQALAADPSARPPLRALQRALMVAAGSEADVDPGTPRRDEVHSEPSRTVDTAAGSGSGPRAAKPESPRGRTLQIVGAASAAMAAFLPWVYVDLANMGSITASGIDGTWRLLGLIPVPGWLPAVAAIATSIALALDRAQRIRIWKWVTPTMAGVGLVWCVPVLFIGVGPAMRGLGSSAFSPLRAQGFDRLISAQPMVGVFLALIAFVVLGVGWYHERIAPRRPGRQTKRDRARRLAATRRRRKKPAKRGR